MCPYVAPRVSSHLYRSCTLRADDEDISQEILYGLEFMRKPLFAVSVNRLLSSDARGAP